MGSQSRRERTVDRNRTDHIDQSSRPVAQANEDRLRLRAQRYVEEQTGKKATSSSQHVASGSQRGIIRKVIEMVDKLKSLSGESVEYKSKILTRFLNHSSISKALKVRSIMSLKKQHIAKLLLVNLANDLQIVKPPPWGHTKDDMIAKKCAGKWTGVKPVRAQRSDILSTELRELVLYWWTQEIYFSPIAKQVLKRQNHVIHPGNLFQMSSNLLRR
ncbi:hypothetical protein R1sor_024157 [Riccia sorocarpa]|uniref:Uncharacterized protein n=1 Tax=Riccia sorocarpa TaxID=122646 RepID=A0ABD3GR84_9MARC